YLPGSGRRAESCCRGACGAGIVAAGSCSSPWSNRRPKPLASKQRIRRIVMTNAASPVILIPARLGSTRLPHKPLADIHGVPMIAQVWRRAMEADIGPVFVAAAEAEIVSAVEAAGGRAVLTNPDHPSGSDRIFEALGQIDPVGRFDVIV